jgi:hypothetical protein
VTTPHEQEREARERIERLRFYADSFYGLPGQPQLLRLTEGQAELLAVDIRKVCNELERVTSIAEVARMKEEMMRAQRERDRADDRAEHWYGQYEALKQENLNLRIRMEVDNEP